MAYYVYIDGKFVNILGTGGTGGTGGTTIDPAIEQSVKDLETSVEKINTNVNDITVDISGITTSIGSLSSLATSNKQNLVSAISENTTSASLVSTELAAYKKANDTQVKTISDAGLSAISDISVLKVDITSKADKTELDNKVDKVDYNLLQQTMNSLKDELISTLVANRLRLDALDNNTTYVQIPTISVTSTYSADDLQISGIYSGQESVITFDVASGSTLVLDVPEAYKGIVTLNANKIKINPTEALAGTSFTIGVTATDGTNNSFKNIIPVKIKSLDAEVEKETYYILIVAGQSNAVGYDESPITLDEIGDMGNDLLQLGYNTQNLELKQLTPCADNFQDMSSFINSSSVSGYTGTKGIHLPLARLLKANLKNPNAKIVVLPCAYGGTGFSTSADLTYNTTTMKVASGVSKWGSDSSFYKAMRDRLQKLLADTTIDAKYLGTVWCLGEQDGSTNNFAKWYSGFTTMTNIFESEMSAYNSKSVTGSFNEDTWFVYEGTNYTFKSASNYRVCQMIWHEYRNILGNMNYIHLSRGSDITNETNGTGATSSSLGLHFGNGAFRTVIAPKVADAIAYKYNDTNLFKTIPTKSVNSNLVQLTFENGGLFQPSDTTLAGQWIYNKGIVRYNGELPTLTGYPLIKDQSVFLNTDDYDVLMWTPAMDGYWLITCLNENKSTATTDSYAIFGLVNNLFGRTLHVRGDGTTSQIRNGTTKFTIYPLDVFLLIRIPSASKQILYRVKGTDGSVELCTTMMKSLYTGQALLGGSNANLALGFMGKIGVIQSNFSSSMSTEGTRLIINPVGLKSAGMSDFFANTTAPTNDEIIKLVEEYHKIDFGSNRLR